MMNMASNDGSRDDLIPPSLIPESLPTSDIQNELEASLRDARVLIVDDDRAMCRYLASLVEGWGGLPFTANTLSRAIRVRREVEPDVILLDVLMPYVDGYKITKLFKSQAPSTPIILLTALDDIESKRRGLVAGAAEFLTKPVDPRDLQLRLSSMLRFKRVTAQLEATNQTLAALATVDALTGVSNRRALDDRLAVEHARWTRYQQPFSCFLIDIDHFKKVNDTWGHPVGDKVLTAVAQAIVTTIRASDLGGRFGGEEFMVLAPETTGADAMVLGERLRRNIAEHVQAVGGLPPVTVSIGLATSDTCGGSADAIVASADAALYEAKKTGRDRVVAAAPPR